MDEAVQLLVPENDCPNPVFSIVIPALNESHTIRQFVAWCHEGIRTSGLPGEILIVDSSSDGTAELAHAAGARVLKTPKRGLGRAYIDALPYVRGRYMILGDCDCTYDFRELKPFIRELQAGADFVMGSRMRGSIESGAMPALHQYFGTPLTTALLNFMYSCNFSDIHCGMRALTREAFVRMNMRAQTWEYASEMIIKAIKLNMRTAEVPIKFYKDMEGRTSNLKRLGWWGPWLAGWQTLRIFSLFKPDFFLRKPGYIMFFAGMLILFGLAAGPLTLGGIQFSLHTQLMGLLLFVMGSSFLQLDALTTLYLGYDVKRCTHLLRRYRYDSSVPAAGFLVFLGLLFTGKTMYLWLSSGFALFTNPYQFIAGIGLLFSGITLFLKSLTITLMGNREMASSPIPEASSSVQQLQTLGT